MSASTQVNSTASVFGKLLAAAAGGPLPEWEQVRIETCTLARGGTVFAQDQAHPFVYAVREGLVKLVYLDEDGDEWIKSFIAEGRFFASVAALARSGRTTFMAVAVEPAVVERIAYDDIASLAAKHLAWSRAVGTLTMTYAARKEQRERELLTLSAEERFIAFQRQHASLIERIPQKDLARHLGVTPVGLNRIIARVRAGG